MANVKLKPNFKKVEGILVPGAFKPECIKEAMNYKPVLDDLFIETYPKCGTTWMQNVAIHILRKGKELDDPMVLRTQCPFIDPRGLQGILNMTRPGILKTHLPFTHVPYSPDAKYIYVLRNPKDCCVSMYYHTKRNQARIYGEATFDDFFEIFMDGEVEYGDYFDHLMSWYPHIHDKNVFFTTYEDMKEDLRDVVLKLASFIGQEYIEAIEKDNSVLQNILRFSSFDYMKNNMGDLYKGPQKPLKEGGSNEGEKSGEMKLGEVEEHEKKSAELEECEKKPPTKGEKIDFIRKGIIGDWMNHFSEEQNDRMNKKFVERTQGTEIFDMYKSYMGL